MKSAGPVGAQLPGSWGVGDVGRQYGSRKPRGAGGVPEREGGRLDGKVPERTRQGGTSQVEHGAGSEGPEYPRRGIAPRVPGLEPVRGIGRGGSAPPPPPESTKRGRTSSVEQRGGGGGGGGREHGAGVKVPSI